MALTFREIQDEVSRRATRDQGGSQFTSAIKTLINTSLLRISREAPWRAMRRKATFSTIPDYTTGTGAVTLTKGSKNVSVVGATFLTDRVQIGRRVKFSGDGAYYLIDQITSETAFVINLPYAGTSTTTGSYDILGQETYNLPIQSGHRSFLWHEAYGFPLKLKYLTDFDFYKTFTYVYIKYIPNAYRMWGEDMVVEQLRSPSVVSVASSSALDASAVQVVVFGIVDGYPDSEVLTLNGLSPVTSTKTFSSVERVAKNAATSGLVTLTGNSGRTTVAVIPIGNITSGIQYKKIQVWPLPTTAFPINVQYYKDPYNLVNDYDVHELGAEFDEALILLSVAKLRSDTNQGENANVFQYFQDEINNLKKTNVDKIDWLPTLERPFQSGNAMAMVGGMRGFSPMQAGPMFGNVSYL
jgi:hypothetical protein